MYTFWTGKIFLSFFWYFLWFFEEKNLIFWKNYTNFLPLPQTTRCNFWMVLQFSIVPNIPTVYGKLPKTLILLQNFAVEMWENFHIFFRKWDIFLQKIVKNTKKMIKIFFLSKKYTLVPKLSYMFYEKYFMK